MNWLFPEYLNFPVWGLDVEVPFYLIAPLVVPVLKRNPPLIAVAGLVVTGFPLGLLLLISTVCRLKPIALLLSRYPIRFVGIVSCKAFLLHFPLFSKLDFSGGHQ